MHIYIDPLGKVFLPNVPVNNLLVDEQPLQGQDDEQLRGYDDDLHLTSDQLDPGLGHRWTT